MGPACLSHSVLLNFLHIFPLNPGEACIKCIQVRYPLPVAGSYLNSCMRNERINYFLASRSSKAIYYRVHQGDIHNADVIDKKELGKKKISIPHSSLQNCVLNQRLVRLSFNKCSKTINLQYLVSSFLSAWPQSPLTALFRQSVFSWSMVLCFG